MIVRLRLGKARSPLQYLVRPPTPARRASDTRHGVHQLAKQQNTYEKRRREFEKKRKAEAKLERRRTKKDAPVRPLEPYTPPAEAGD